MKINHDQSPMNRWIQERIEDTMKSLDETILFKLDDLDKKSVGDTLNIVYQALAEKDYDPINQIVGYLLSGDPAYIPRHKDARNLIRRYERDEIIEALVKYYMANNAS